MPQAFDEQELLERVGDDIGFLAETLQMLESDGEVHLAQIQAALAAGDAPAVGRAAHTLKGMISNFCAPAVSNLALEVERAGKGGDCAAAAAATQRLAPALESLVAELKAFVQARS
jgi:HPt (histidine-containing phosphotransfer) domain-containing protein